MSVTVFIALGSNLGDRQANLAGAIQALRTIHGIEVVRVSSHRETEPVGGPAEQGKYLNSAVQIHTSLSPEALLKELLAIEARLGRVRGEPNAPRTLDLDLLLYGELVRSSPDPIIPHPRMHLRSFVLDPLAELAPEIRHPILNVSVRRLAENLQPTPPPDRPLAGLRGLVTGSTSGIGKAIAESFAAAGAWVIVHGHRNFDKATRLADELRQHDVATASMLAELRDPAQVSRLADDAWSLWQGLDVLVCNAGADTLTGQGARWSFDEKLAELWIVDVKSTIQLSRALGERMKQQGRGLILTMGWDQAETGMEGDSGQLFATVKNAVIGFTRSLALSLAPEVRVNCIAPGWIKTAWGENASQSWQDRIVQETPLKRWGTPVDVAAVAKWLASRDAGFITGQVVRVNGGAVR
jgi:3-oxoacyl-[acyl-carrier protein] reductase